MDRRTVIADAAIEVIAADGLRALTHRAVDLSLGLPAGSTSYYFRTKSDLLTAVAGRVVDLSRSRFLGLEQADVASSIASYLHDVLSRRMSQLRARYALMLEPAVPQNIRDQLGRSFFSVERAESLFHDPAQAAGLVVLCEGVLADAVFGRTVVKSIDALRFTIGIYLDGTGSSPPGNSTAIAQQ